MYPTYLSDLLSALLLSPKLASIISALAERKLALLTLKSTDDEDVVRRRIEDSMWRVARRMGEAMAARIESPRLIKLRSFTPPVLAGSVFLKADLLRCEILTLRRTYGFALQTFFGRLYNLGIHVSVAEVTQVRVPVCPLQRSMVHLF